MNLVSIIIPVYNVEPYLRDCMESVLGQTYKELQVILVNDGSSDGSPAICEEYARKDSRVQVIHQKNGGASVARNSGMAVAKGEYLYFMDSDDMIKPETIERCVDLCDRENLDQMHFISEVLIDHEHSDEVSLAMAGKAYYNVDADEYDGKVMSGPELFTALLSKKAFRVSIPMKFFRKSALPKYLSFPPGWVQEDVYFAPLALVTAKRAIFVPEKFYFRRVRAGSVMTAANSQKKHSAAKLEMIRLLKKRRHLVPPEGIAPYDDFCRIFFIHYRHFSPKTFWNNIRSSLIYYGFFGGVKHLVAGFAQKIWKIFK